jgi:RHS repeat-associated protein
VWTYHWDGDRLAAEELPSGGLRVYVYVDERALVPFMRVDYASADATADQGERFYFLSNQLGAVERVLNDNAETVWRAEHHPYGVRTITSPERFDQPQRWPGHYHDEETGLHYNRFRYYDPSLGRYLEPDPQGLAGGLNLYAYAHNPLVGVDLRGLSDVCPVTGRPLREPDADGVDVESGPRTVRDASGRLRVASGEAGAGQYVGDPNATGSRTRPRPDHVATAGDVQDPRERPLPADHPAVTRRVEAGELPPTTPRDSNKCAPRLSLAFDPSGRTPR